MTERVISRLAYSDYATTYNPLVFIRDQRLEIIGFLLRSQAQPRSRWRGEIEAGAAGDGKGVHNSFTPH